MIYKTEDLGQNTAEQKLDYTCVKLFLCDIILV